MKILNYKKFGNGEKKLIFLHELMGDCTNYENCLIYFDKNLFTIFMVDLRGYGLSKNILGKYNLDEAVNDVINLVTNLTFGEHFSSVNFDPSGRFFYVENTKFSEKERSQIVIIYYMTGESITKIEHNSIRNVSLIYC